jgi:hypothetical protein
VVSSRDRRHFAQIASAEKGLESESIAVAARRSPGENIEIGLELSEFAAAFGGEIDQPDQISPARVWRERRRSER